MVKATRVFWGSNDAMVAEVAAWDPRQIGIPANECQYLVMIDGEGQFEAEWFATKADARRHARYIAKELGAPVCSV